MKSAGSVSESAIEESEEEDEEEEGDGNDDDDDHEVKEDEPDSEDEGADDDSDDDEPGTGYSLQPSEEPSDDDGTSGNETKDSRTLRSGRGVHPISNSRTSSQPQPARRASALFPNGTTSGSSSQPTRTVSAASRPPLRPSLGNAGASSFLSKSKRNFMSLTDISQSFSRNKRSSFTLPVAPIPSPRKESIQKNSSSSSSSEDDDSEGGSDSDGGVASNRSTNSSSIAPERLAGATTKQKKTAKGRASIGGGLSRFQARKE